MRKRVKTSVIIADTVGDVGDIGFPIEIDISVQSESHNFLADSYQVHSIRTTMDLKFRDKSIPKGTSLGSALFFIYGSDYKPILNALEKKVIHEVLSSFDKEDDSPSSTS